MRAYVEFLLIIGFDVRDPTLRIIYENELKLSAEGGSMMNRDVGGMGHNDFSKLCDAAGLIYNSSYNKDAAGWDVFVEFPLNSHLNIFNDKSSQAIQCLVQVKSTDSSKKAVSVKLSNLKRFCDTPLPCFFFFAEYEKGINPVAIYLLHFDKDKIFDVLKRLRECELNGDNRLNKKTMVMKYDDSHKINVFEGMALKERIESYIPHGMGEYAKEKTRYLEELGYEESKYNMIFKLSEQADYSSLVMASLGYENKINIKDITAWDKRFGIGFQISELSTENGVISFSKVEPHSHGDIIFDDGSERLSFSCDFYFSPIAFTAPDELSSYRVKCEHFDMLIGIKTNKINITLASSAAMMDIYDIRDIALLAKMLSDSKVSVEIILRNEDGRETCFVRQTPLFLSDNSKVEIEKTITLASRLIQIAGYFRIEKICKLSLNDLFKKEVNINALFAFIFQAEQSTPVRLQIPDLCETLDNTKPFHVLIGIPLMLKQINVFLTLILKGGFTQDKDIIIFNEYTVSIQSKFCETNLDLLKSKVRKDACRLVEKHESEADIYFVDSLSSHFY